MVKSDGSIWFTDPPFGILGHYEGDRATPELPTNVYRIDGATGQATVVTGDVERPNGLCFSPDESRLYVVASGVAAAGDPGLRRGRGRDAARQRRGSSSTPAPASRTGSAATPTGTCGAGGVAARATTASPSSRPTGAPIGRIDLPERCANVCFGGLARNRLFMAASQSIYACYVNAQGAPGG